MLGKAIRIASEAFENTKDKGNKPYILHLLYVMNKVAHLGETAMICAVLHDLFEDKEQEGYNAQYLLDNGFSHEIISILNLLTHKPGVSYMDNIKTLSFNPIAKAIKLADLEHNSKITRLKNLSKKTFDRLELYCQAYTYLNS